MEEKTYTKLSLLVDNTFTVEGVEPFVFKKWDAEQHKMLVSIIHEKGYRKLYPVTTDKGSMDLGSGQLGNLLEAVFFNGRSDLIGKTFNVKSNGKSGMDIRYFFNPVKAKEISIEPVPSDEFDQSQIPEDWV